LRGGHPGARFGHRPAKVLESHVRQCMTVLEPGPGMGFFTLELARLVGCSGRVVVVDIQSRMLDGLRRRAAKAGVLGRIEARLASPDSLGVADLAGAVDFTLAFAMVHELPAAAPFFREVAQASKPGARLLFVEPAGTLRLRCLTQNCRRLATQDSSLRHHHPCAATTPRCSKG